MVRPNYDKHQLPQPGTGFRVLQKQSVLQVEIRLLFLLHFPKWFFLISREVFIGIEHKPQPKPNHGLGKFEKHF
jgi:hypothetical protein